MTDKQRIEAGAEDLAIGLEVHVDGWGYGPFFAVRGFDIERGLLLLSTRYSRAVKYRIPRERAYFTRSSAKGYRRKLESRAALKTVREG